MIDPLAICDARTIPQEGFILLQRRYPHRTAEGLPHRPSSRIPLWYDFPQMDAHDEALVFKVFDFDARWPARFTAHTAFDDPEYARRCLAARAAPRPTTIPASE